MNQLSNKRKAAVESVMKDAIIDAAIDTLLEHGLDGLTMDRVAQAAGLSKGTLYNYFQNKQKLQLHLFAKITNPIHQQIAIIHNDKASPVDKLVKIVKQLFMGYEEKGSIVLILAEGRLQNLKEYSKQLEQIEEFAHTEIAKNPIEQIIHSVMLDGIESKHFRDMDPVLATDMVLGVVSAILDKQIENNQPRVPQTHIAKSIEFITSGLMCPASPTTNIDHTESLH